MSSDRARNRAVLRSGLLILAVPDAIVGVWGLVAPGSFYRSFPPGDGDWVKALGLYDEHLVTDFAGALLALAVMLALAAAILERRVVQVVLVGVFVEGLAHFVYHLTRLDVLPTGENIASQIGLAFGPLLALALLWLNEKAARTPTRPG